MNTLKLAWVIVLAVVMGSMVGCVSEPFDGERIANFPTTIIPKVSGWSPTAEETIEVYAQDSSTGVFELVAATTASASGLIWNDTTWYYWSINDLDLDPDYWTPKFGGACGAKATLRVKMGSFYGLSLNSPFNECFDYSMTTNEFFEECKSDNSPEFTVDTCGALCC